MRKVASLNERIRVRAYYLSLGSEASDIDNWLVAERMELDRVTKLSRSAVKAAATRQAKQRSNLGVCVSPWYNTLGTAGTLNFSQTFYLTRLVWVRF